MVVGVPVYLAQPVVLDVLDSVEATAIVTPRETFTMEHQIYQPSLDTFNTATEANAVSSKIVLYTVEGYGYEADKAPEKKSGLSAWLFGCCEGKRSDGDSAN
tara:strand:+ start:220 stop:525 length:306 start_codon:yes stop_codon:yes gene_type:complete